MFKTLRRLITRRPAEAPDNALDERNERLVGSLPGNTPEGVRAKLGIITAAATAGVDVLTAVQVANQAVATADAAHRHLDRIDRQLSELMDYTRTLHADLVTVADSEDVHHVVGR